MSTTTITQAAVAVGPLSSEDKIRKVPTSSDVEEPTTNLYVLPKFANLEEQRKWSKEQLAGAFRLFAKFGYAEGFNGHISLRDPIETSTFWINAYGIHFSRIKVSNLVRIDHDGNFIEGPPGSKVNKAGFIIHSQVHSARPDLHVVAHAHSPYGRAWSAFGRPIEMLNQDACFFYDDLSVYEGFGGVVFKDSEGSKLAETLGPKNRSIILQNHGLLTCGETVGECINYFVTLERACQAQLLVEAAAANGIPKRLIGEEEARWTKETLDYPEVMNAWFNPEYSAILYECNGEMLE